MNRNVRRAALLAALILTARPSRATVCALGVCYTTPPINTGSGGYRGGNGGYNSGGGIGIDRDPFEGRGLFTDNAWPDEKAGFDVPLFSKSYTTTESHFKDREPDPKALDAARERSRLAKERVAELNAALLNMPADDDDAALAALAQCQHFVDAMRVRIETATPESAKGLGDAAFYGAVGCGTGPLSGSAAYYHKVDELEREYVEADAALSNRLGEEAAIAERTAYLQHEKDLQDAIAKLPASLQSPLVEPPPLAATVEALPTPPDADADKEKKKKKKLISLLADAQAMDKDASQSSVVAKATEKALEETRQTAAAALPVLVDDKKPAGERSAAAEKIADAADTLHTLKTLDPQEPSRSPKGAVTLTAGAKPGEVVAVESDGQVSVPSPGLRVEYTDREGVARSAVTGPDGVATIATEKMPLAGGDRAVDVKVENGGAASLTYAVAAGAAAPTLSEKLAGGLPADESSRLALAQEAGVTDHPTPASLVSASRARQAANSGDQVAAASALEDARRDSPWWADGAWASAVAAEAASADAGVAAAAPDRYALFANDFPNDPRAAEAARRAAVLRGLAADIALPAQDVYENVEVVHKVPRHVDLPLPTFASPNWYLDVGGAALGSSIKEYHVGRVLLYSTTMKFGIGTTVFTQYDTPFLTPVSGPDGNHLEKTNLDVFFPLELSFSPINFRIYKNFVVAPQLYLTTSSFGTISTTDIHIGDAPYNVAFTDYGLKIPLGALAGFRIGSLSMTTSSAGPNAKGFSYGGITERKSYAAIELFFGGMFGVPKPL